ncbi:hypothetical protein A2467_01050 [Candidatus Nomurabacteria bacterium RIFOXYC2_FULL_36_8]|nr:MAG: hypothetical protein UR97_C0004G0048 [Candidatus Nomurabacteria bacterium GW2011_GWE2_36_115]KKP94179.1 MAG: hypothetical protein US00_C0003G0103 [Candidatus Nomurabacteria bacterium GW2011_GWF2_36_126]KKP96693.1 MAG: hypothetical protein US04_C0001G0195 [Candidatus Nomurabacteria bacterium GW2011_GWD2_36_14]KKP99703.1 MAG: hypothetical protein US08_C0001G0386 [Candidatus Nomurabacteria bacterium GW2011_GWF2_36_19]KKQ05351.1 MAG: hypothetical protein US17_C0005G0118 [Candidatus Nomuraba
MANNYDAWKVSVTDFEEQKSDYDKLLFFLRFGILAPSSHNSQPWEFQIDVEKLSINVFKSKVRVLPVGDPNDDLSYVSIGCTVENIVVTADYFGYTVSVVYEENPQIELCAILQFTQDHSKSIDSSHLIHQIKRRIVNRGKYEQRNLPDEFLEKIQKFSTTDHKVVLIQDSQTIADIGKIANYASIQLMSSYLFRRELSTHVKNNFTESYVGIPAFGMQIPGILSLIVPNLIKLFNMDKFSEKQNTALFTKYTPEIIVLTSKNNTKKDKLIIGRMYQNIALNAISQDIKTSPWGSVSVYSESNKELQKVLNTEFYPEFLFRIGYNNKDPHHSPRLLVNSVIKK